ncbi:MAG: hypothetical protein IJ760_03375 [Bacteroidales bacterium]|nr:hypothetical protein [Bacteroidales bacterium]
MTTSATYNPARKARRRAAVLVLAALLLVLLPAAVRAQATYTYYAMQINGTGWLKQAQGAVANDGKFLYGNPYDDNGNSLWVYSSDGYLQNCFYYLNASGSTLYLSDCPLSKWDVVEVDGKQRFQLHGTDMVLGYSGGVVLASNPSQVYTACEATLEETSHPTTYNALTFTVRSPQPITYLRTYLTRKVNITLAKDDTGKENAIVKNSDQRLYCRLTFVSTTHAGKGTSWDITPDGTVYNLTASKQNSITMNCSVEPLDPIARELYPAVEKVLTLAIEARHLTPADATKYLLFNTHNTSLCFPADDDGMAEGDAVTMVGNDQLTESNDNISWVVERDGRDYYSFRSVATGRYLYFDTADRRFDDLGTARLGADALPGDDNRYKFRLFNAPDNIHSGCTFIVPYDYRYAFHASGNGDYPTSMRFALKSDGVGHLVLAKGGDNARWRIYPYTWVHRLRTDSVVRGQTYAREIGGYDLRWQTAYSRNIEKSPANNRDLECRGSWDTDTVKYSASLTGLNAYATLEEVKNDGRAHYIVRVNTMPSTTVSGTFSVTAKTYSDATRKSSIVSTAKSVVFYIYPSQALPDESEFTPISSLSEITDPGGYYKLSGDVDALGHTTLATFTGCLDGDGHTISGLSTPLIGTLTGTVRNLVLDGVAVSGSGDVGAVACVAGSTARVYNVGVLGGESTVRGDGTGSVGGLVGRLEGSAHVVNCYSFATVGGGTWLAGLVGYNSVASTQDNQSTMVMNCMFYGELDYGSLPQANYSPVFGGNTIANGGEKSMNNYCYFRDEALFDDSYTSVDNYRLQWPAEEQYLTRFEYHRSILNSNRRLCAFWITGHEVGDQTAADTALVWKWVLDESIAPYPVLKRWGRYPSVINADTARVWDAGQAQWVDRGQAAGYRGKRLGWIEVTVKPGTHNRGAGAVTLNLPATDMDTTHHDYGYCKVQLPYYNEVFGNPATADHHERYGMNYTDSVVTGWKITAVDKHGTHSFVANWENGYNYADRHCTGKDLYDTCGRVFAQGGYYYVPEGVQAITIEAYWGKALYLHGNGHYVDRVSVTKPPTSTSYYGYGFTPAGVMDDTFNGMHVYDDLATVVQAVPSNSKLTVYDCAIVLLGNFQVRAGSNISLAYKERHVTFMSADLDLDNEPDFVWELQWRGNVQRPGILPVRFDFLPVVELGTAIRHDSYAYAIGIFVPQGHFEITETSFMHTTQFEYMSTNDNVSVNHQQALILNGGHFEQIVASGSNYGKLSNTRNIVLGGNVWMKRFTPGTHSGNNKRCAVRHCAISVLGGDYPEFYLSGIWRDDINASRANDDNPHCFINGGHFGTLTGAGMESVRGSVTFQIDHAIIDEFYGGGINSTLPVLGDITVSIDHSLVGKYCGGPKVGSMAAGKKVTTTAVGSTFGEYYGGGNGGTNLLRVNITDQTPSDMPGPSDWNGDTYKFGEFKPVNNFGEGVNYESGRGYHCEFEFEVFNQSNGLGTDAVARTFNVFADFGTTVTGSVSNTLDSCLVLGDYYGGGNLGNVSGDVVSVVSNSVVEGSAYGGGFSAAIPSFRVHDRRSVTYPTRDRSGVCHNGVLDYLTDVDGKDVYFTWIHEDAPAGVNQNNPVFEADGKWYCYTTLSLLGLGAVSGSTSIAIDGNTLVKGSVFGAGNESRVEIDSRVVLSDNGEVRGNVYGGGNKASVGGNTFVEITE